MRLEVEVNEVGGWKCVRWGLEVGEVGGGVG